MTRIPSSKVEEKAARAVSDAIDSCALLKADIKFGEKGISWDGDIYLYNNPEQNKNQLEGILPAQVKGKVVKNYSGKYCSFPVEVSDIKNYLIKKGIIFFVVEMNESMSEYRIYYATLLPVDLRELLEKCKVDQKTISIHLKNIPNNRINSFQYICKDAICNMKLQWSDTFIELNEINKMSKVELRVTPEDGDVQKYVLENGLYVYGKYNDKEPLRPFKNKINIAQTILGFKKSISVHGKKFYSEYKVVTERDGNKSIQFGKEISLVIDNIETKLNYNSNGSLEERIRDLEFLVNLFRAKSINIDGKEYPIDFDDTTANKKTFEKFEKALLVFKKTKNTLNTFGIVYEGNMEDLFDKNNYLEWLINYTEGNVKFNSLVERSGIYHLNIGPLYIGIFVLIKDDNTLDVYNLFSDFYKILCIHSTDNNGNDAIISPYITLNAEEIVKFSNFNLGVVENSVKIMDLSEYSSNLLNLFLLQVIKAYDKEPKRNELLLLAESIQSHIDDYSPDSIINIINRLQICKRQRALNKEEKSELLKIRNTTDNNQMLCAISILLDNISDYEYYYDKLTDEEKTTFSNYPIYNLRISNDTQSKTG